MKSKIVWKLTACFALVLLLFTAVLGAVFVIMFRQHTVSINRLAMEQRALSIAVTLSEFQTGQGADTGRGRMGGYGAYLRFLDDLAMAEVWIVNKDMTLLTTGHGPAANYSDLPKGAGGIVNRVFQGEITYGEEFSSLLDSPTLTVGVPILTEGHVTGAVLLHSPVSGVNEAVRQGFSALAASAAAALFFSGAAAVWLSYRFTIPLNRMKAAALNLSDGNYGAKTGVAQSDEIGRLAQTIDLLADRLLLAQQEQSNLDQMKQDFIANVSHELRTPVAVLRGSLEVLRDKTVSSPEEILDYYDHMLAESRHLERLVNDLLDSSRLQDAQFSLDMEEVNLCDIVRDAARGIRKSIQKKNIELFIVYPREECIVNGDYGRIRQLVLILMDNAVKFSIEDGVVELSLIHEGGQCLLSVLNHGNDIPKEKLPHLFDRFYKERSPQNHSGTGLGLAIAKQIADRHGATVDVKSSQGKTYFFVHFPLVL